MNGSEEKDWRETETEGKQSDVDVVRFAGSAVEQTEKALVKATSELQMHSGAPHIDGD